MLAHLAGRGLKILRAPKRRQLDEHRQIDPGNDFDLVGLEKGEAEIGWSPAKHVGQNQDARVALDSFDRIGNVSSGIVRFVVPPNRHRDKLRQVTHDHFGRVDQLVRQLSVRDDDDPDHRLLS